MKIVFTTIFYLDFILFEEYDTTSKTFTPACISAF